MKLCGIISAFVLMGFFYNFLEVYYEIVLCGIISAFVRNEK